MYVDMELQRVRDDHETILDLSKVSVVELPSSVRLTSLPTEIGCLVHLHTIALQVGLPQPRALSMLMWPLCEVHDKIIIQNN